MTAAMSPARRLPGRLAAATAVLAAGLSLAASAGASDDLTTEPTPPTPSGLTAYAVGDGRVLLDWQDSAVPSGRYQVYRDGRRIADGPIRSEFLDEGLQNGRVYEYRVSAGSAEPVSAWTGAVEIAPFAGRTAAPVRAGDQVELTAAPAVPAGLTATPAGGGSIALDWDDANAPFGRYQVYRDDKLIADGPIRSEFMDEGLEAGRVYSYRVSAGNAPSVSAWSDSVESTPVAPGPPNLPIPAAAPSQDAPSYDYESGDDGDDSAPRTKPAIPTGLRVVSVAPGRVELDWRDNSGVFGRYQVYRDDELIANGPAASAYVDTCAMPGRTYAYRVSAGSHPVYGDWTAPLSVRIPGSTGGRSRCGENEDEEPDGGAVPTTPTTPTSPTSPATDLPAASAPGAPGAGALALPAYGKGLVEGNGAAASLTTAPAPGARGGSQIAKLVMPPSRGAAANVPNRRLLDISNLSWRSGADLWYGVSFYFGNDWQLEDIADSREQFTSIFSFRYASVDNGTGSFMLFPGLGGPRIVHARAALSVDDYAGGGGRDPLDLGPVVKGRWINLICHFKWSTGTDAIKECWRDGKFMGRSTKPNMHVDAPVTHRVGLYQGTGVDHQRTLMWANHRVGKSLAEVTPR